MTCGNQKCPSMECTVVRTGLSPWRLHARLTLDWLLVFVALSAMAGPAAVQGQDTTPPGFVRAEVFSAGNVVVVYYFEDLDHTVGAHPPVSAFTLTVDGAEVTVVSVVSQSVFPKALVLILRNEIYQDQTVTLSYADPTEGDDEQATQDLAGNAAASFTNQVVTNNSTMIMIVSVLRASPRSPTSIWLEWDVLDGVDLEDITGYRLEAIAGITWTDLVDYTGDRTSLRYTMHRGLEPATTYSYRITPVTDRGTGTPSAVVEATTEVQPSVIDGLSYVARYSSDGADLCWTPDGVSLSELSEFQYGRMNFEFDENSALPWEDDGTFSFNSIRTPTSCNNGAGRGTFLRAISGLEYFVKLRAQRNGQWVESNTVTVQVINPNTTLKAQIIAEGFYGIGPDGEPVFPDVPATVTGPFEIAVGFGYQLPMDASLTEVTGLEVGDFAVTNATVSAPPDGFTFGQFIGYRVIVTPTTLGQDLTVQVKAGAVTGEGTTKTNLASNIFRRKTGASGKVVAAVRGAPTISRLEPNYPNPFNSTTQITYRLAAAGPVRLAIFNVLGQSVRTLVDQVQAAGFYQVHWDGRDQRGGVVSTGVYLMRLHYPGGVQAGRLLLLK